MENIKLTILHRDVIFAKEFCAALLRYWKFVSIFVVSSVEEKKRINTDYILTDNGVLAAEFQEKGIHLYDDVIDVQETVFSIDRFQPIRSIASQLIAYCASDTQSKHLSLKDASDTTFIGITSGVGGSGTSSLAVCMGRILCRLYQRTALYISFEMYKPLSSIFCFNNVPRSFDRLLYHLTSKDKDCTLNIEDYLSEDTYSLKYISFESKFNSFAQIEEDDMYRLLNCIACCGKFDVVILDVPSSFSQHKSVMRMCEKQVVNFGFKKHCQISSELMQEDLEELCAFDMQGVADRLFAFHPLEDSESFILTETGFDIDIHGQFGAEVRAFVDSLEVG